MFRITRGLHVQHVHLPFPIRPMDDLPDPPVDSTIDQHQSDAGESDESENVEKSKICQ